MRILKSKKYGAPGQPGHVPKLKPAPTPEPEPDEHPEDRAMRLEGEAFGAAHGATFFEEHRSAFVALIATYNDAAAEAMLDALREKFWGGDWKPKPERADGS